MSLLPPKHAEEEARLAALRRYGILDTDEEQAFDDVTRLLAAICDAPISVINLIDRERQWFKSEIGLGVRETPLDISICAHAILQPGVFVVPDTHMDARFEQNPLVTGDPHLRFYAGALLESSDGYPLGTLCVLDYQPRELNERQRDALQVLARQVMAQFELRLAMREQAEYARKQASVAETLQRSLLLVLPEEDAFPGVSIDVLYEAASSEAMVGGDFSDAFAVEERVVALVVGDVTGKGLRAATYTAEIKYALRAFLRESPDPAQALSRLNHYLIEGQRLDASPREEYVSLAVAVLDTVTGELRCSAAGAEPPLIVRSGSNGDSEKAEVVDVSGPLLGIDMASDFIVATARLERGDLFAFTTDGITEARQGRRGDLFGYERFVDAVTEAAEFPSLREAGQAVMAAALNFASGNQSDDICLLLARLR